MVHSIKRIFLYGKPYKIKMIVALLLGMAGSIINLTVPNMINKIADLIGEQLYTEIDISSIMRYVAIALASISIYAICNFISSMNLAKYGKYIGRDIRNILNDKINHITLAQLDTVPSGDIISRLVSDTEIIESAIGRNLNNVVTNTAIFSGTLVMMFCKSIRLALCSALTVFTGILIITFLRGKVTPLIEEQQTKLSLVNTNINEALTGHTLIRLFNSEEEVLNKFNQNNDLLSRGSAKAQFLSSLIPTMMGLISNLSFAMVVLFAVYLRNGGHTEITIGVIVAFIMYSKMFANAVSLIFNNIYPLMQMEVSMGRIEEVLNMPEIIDEGKTGLSTCKGKVVFDHVRFGYVEDKEIIHDFSAVIEPGMKVAIVGPTGAGKSTLINLLMGFYELDSGAISIDGVDISEMSRENLHDILGMVLQESWIFTGSVKDNLIYSTEGITDERLSEVIRDCKLDYFINNLSDGVDTIIKEDSVSAGQGQLLTIARVMLKDPDILILDEATSSVDTRTEKNIQQALDLLSEHKTSFVIAHRLSTIKNADLIFVLKDGDIIEMGNHNVLLEKGGFYSELYYSQFEEGEE